jgi:hypothetical protein
LSLSSSGTYKRAAARRPFLFAGRFREVRQSSMRTGARAALANQKSPVKNLEGLGSRAFPRGQEYSILPE